MRRLGYSTVGAAILGLVVVGCGQQRSTPAESGAVTTTQATTLNVRIPISVAIFVPCAQGGAGERVQLEGDLHVQIHMMPDGRGGLHVQSHANPQGVSGVGDTSGAKYQGTGVTRSDFKVAEDGRPVTLTFVNNFLVIGQGAGNNFRVHETLHVTVNANGETTAFVDNFRSDCS